MPSQKLTTTEVKVLEVLRSGPQPEPAIRYALRWAMGGPGADGARRNMARVLSALSDRGMVRSVVSGGRLTWARAE